MRIAITRQVSPSIGRCELTHVERQEIDYRAAVRQHGEYERLLAKLGCEVRSLPAASDLPDSVFVEDTAVVLQEIAVITRPGADSRKAEIPSVAAAIALHRPMAQIVVPGTLEGGDVLAVDRRVYVGMSTRTNASGVQQLSDILRPFGYTVCTVEIKSCLHLKSAVTRVAPDALLVNPLWVDRRELPDDLGRIEVDPAEPFAANALQVGDRVVYPAAHRRTVERLVAAGVRVDPIDISEISKAEGGVTCCSVIFDT